ncbi:T9SS type A sorting domain-containing protein [Armatimonadetes bacterium]|nr:T9SS type A sorting domain-containing protein [bacterium]
MKQIDLDGGFHYSSIVSVSKNNQIVSISPNPAKNNIVVSTGAGKDYMYCLFDYNGRLVKRGKLIERRIDISSLPAGVFLLQLQNKNEVLTFKLTKK